MKLITHCRLCENEKLTGIFNLGVQSFTGIFPKNKNPVAKGPLELFQCNSCGLVQLGHSANPSLLYGDSYGYRSGLNQSMVKHLQGLSQRLMQFRPLSQGDVVVDIGSNDGTFLGFFPGTCELIGVDPTIKKFKSYYKPHIKTIPDFFDGRKITKKAKIVSSIAMLYDLENPKQFARHVADILTEDGIWFFEQSYLPTMIDKVAYDTICHEHLEYYGVKQLKMLVKEAGLSILDLWETTTNGGSIAVIAGQGPESKEVERFERSEAVMGLWSLAGDARRARDNLLFLLAKLKREGKKVLGYGASTKGNVILQFCKLTSQDIPFIAEVNEDKWGAFTPGTGIEIISEERARAMKPDYFLVFPWHFKEAIIEREKAFLAEGGGLIFPLPKFPSIVREKV